jgi:hypothetical protein
MSACNHVLVRRPQVVRTYQGEIAMKKLMSVMLGLSLLLGVATVSFAQDDGGKKEGKKKGKKKKKEGDVHRS